MAYESPLPDQHDDSLFSLVKERDRLINQIEKVKADIIVTMEEFPFNVKEIIADKAKIEACRADMEKQVEQYQLGISTYQALIEEMIR